MGVSIAENLVEVRKRLKRAARKAGRDITEITLIAVTKTIEVKRVKEAIKEGLRVFGESYLQEAQEKINKIGDKKKKWHFVGHLQKNKARFAVELFDCIHSVDTPGLAREINRRASHPIDVLIQVNISGEKTKHGATPEGAMEIARMMPGLKNLNFRGLMAIPPPVDAPERSRPYFITLRRLAERINRERIPGVVVHDLSMGMSSDFDVAIEEGATMVRVGTAIFGPREAPPQKVAAKKTGGKKEAPAPVKEKAKTPLKKKPLPKKAVAGKTGASKKTAGLKKAAAVTKKPAARTKKAASPKKAAGSAKKTTIAAKKPASATKKAVVKTKKAVVKTKKAVPVKKTAAIKKTAAVTKKAAAKKAAPPKKAAAITKKKTAKATGSGKTPAGTRAQKAKKSNLKKTTAKKTKAPEASKKTAAKKGAPVRTKKKAAPKAAKKKAPGASAAKAAKKTTVKKAVAKKSKKTTAKPKKNPS